MMFLKLLLLHVQFTMKSAIIFLSTFWALSCFGQFPASHLEILSKINAGLTDSWTSDIECDTSFSNDLDIPFIDIDLFNYKTEENSENPGVGIYLFEKKNSSMVEDFDWSKNDSLPDFKLLSTKSYIVVIDWYINNNYSYNNLVKKLIPELNEFFLRNKEKL